MRVETSNRVKAPQGAFWRCLVLGRSLSCSSVCIRGEEVTGDVTSYVSTSVRDAHCRAIWVETLLATSPDQEHALNEAEAVQNPPTASASRKDAEVLHLPLPFDELRAGSRCARSRSVQDDSIIFVRFARLKPGASTLTPASDCTGAHTLAPASDGGERSGII
jgi:hypothetical protein